MCIIIFDNRKSKEKIDMEVLKRAQKKNSDGIGIMWASKGKLNIFRTVKDIGGIWSRYCNARHNKIAVAIHFRAGTKGSKNSFENVHPFTIYPGFAFMHNGTMKDLAEFLPDGTSDTRYFNDELLKTLPKNFLQSPIHRISLKAMLDGGRAFFMDSTGAFTMLNETRWGAKWENGIWYSKGEHLNYYLTGKEYEYANTPYTKWENNYERTFPMVTGGPIISKVVKTVKQITSGGDSKNPKGKKSRKAEKLASVQDIPMLTMQGIPVTGPKPTKKSNLLFDYGFLMRHGYYDERLKERCTASISHTQLWAIGKFGEEIPAAIPTKGSCIVGTIFEITKDFAAVLALLDQKHGCDLLDPSGSVYYRRYIKVTAPQGDVWGWVYKYAIPLTQVDQASVVPFGDWTRWCSKDNKTPQSEVGTLVIDRLNFKTKYECPLCGKDTETEPVLVWRDSTDYILLCGSCNSKSTIYEQEFVI